MACVLLVAATLSFPGRVSGYAPTTALSSHAPILCEQRVIRVLLALLRPLMRLARAAERIADVLESTAAPPPPAREIMVYMTDPSEEDARRDSYSRHLGRELAPDEEIPDGFNPDDPSGAVAAFLRGARQKGH